MEEKVSGGNHVLVVPYPSQGHINPMLQFSKRLCSKGLRVTMLTTIFISNSMHLQSSSLLGSVQLDFISDGYDEGGFAEAASIESYLSRMQEVGSKSLRELINKYNSSDKPIDCVVYDPLLIWVLDVAKEFRLLGAAFFTQMCAVNFIYYHVYHGLLKVPILSPISVPGLPLLHPRDAPPFVCDPAFYPAYFHLVINQFSNIHKADLLLVNSFYKLEDQVVDSMSKVFPVLTIGPTVPSFHLDKAIPDDTDNVLNLFELDTSPITWLKQKPPESVIYISFGSMVCFSSHQMEEIAFALMATGFNFLWVIPDFNTKNLSKEMGKKIDACGRGLIVNWAPQLEVLSNHAVGCFFTHCGWNSTLEALCLGVPMVALPQWTDQPTDAKFVEDVWKVGIRLKEDENGIVTREEIQNSIRVVMEKELGREMRSNAKKWKELAIEAVTQGGTSDHNINLFIKHLKKS
ncbi:UDP-glycosyltransferase 74F1 [Vigna radiata var. radiata]|uniref:Glycosyltransferase n=1 Tax=Vigna radiata var. radiata TaxID=3916 RepID=A0A1S3UIX4_VIGRR|nr:UDP-glycosyltransferase 74F1 [Vigna radiata var. radiata]XP_014505981.1 UDP-glycosyltransferase 74F1 [Vigna radiata var. radiata]